MRRLLAAVIACTLSATPLVGAAGGAQTTASVAGTARSNAGQPMANSTVQLRNLATGQLVGTTTSSSAGAFIFAGLPAGRYAVEVLNATGQIVGTSAALDVAAGAAISGVGVSAGAAGAAATGTGAGLSTGWIVTITAAAIGAGVGIYAGQSGSGATSAQATASPSR